MTNEELQQLKSAIKVRPRDTWGSSVVLKLIAKVESLSAPAVSNGAQAELPPMPSSEFNRVIGIGGGVEYVDAYTIDQIRDYARAAIAAAGPNVALVEALRELLPIIKNLDDCGPEGQGYQSDLMAKSIFTIGEYLASVK